MSTAATKRPIVAAMLDAALRLASSGWRLFPCAPRAKEPLIKSWPSIATSDTNTIQRWAERYSGCNWGLATGATSGIWVLDSDGETGAAALQALRREHGEEWLLTRTCITARGFHFYFRWPEGVNIRNSVGKIGSGLDVRGAGGYVLLPPSVHPDGAIYRWKDADAEIKSAPSWLLEKITSPAQRAPIAADISILPQGRRNDGFTRLGGALRRKGAAQAEIETALRKANERRCRPALPDAEIRKIAESVSRYLPGGPDSLETAWRAIQNEVHPSRYTSFLALCRHLQAARPPGFPIALPLERIGSLMACHWTQVRRWRRRAVSGGQLRPVERYVKKRKAAQYAYVECPTREENTCPTREDVPLRSTTSGLVGQSEKSPSGTVKQISLRAQGGRISTFPHCPRCASHALYRKNNVGNYECQSCGLQDIGESAARRTQ